MNVGVMNIKVNRSSRAFSSKDCTGGKLTLASLKLLVGHSNRLGIYVMVVLRQKKNAIISSEWPKWSNFLI